MEKYINIEDGYPEQDKPVEVVCSDGSKKEVFWSHQIPGGWWKYVESGFLAMINVEKWKYI